MRLFALTTIGLACVVGSGCTGARHFTTISHDEIPTGSVAGFGWVAGHWEDASGDGRFEEGWFGENGGAMVGVFRLIGKRGPIVYEFMRLTGTDGRLVMEITHFNGDGTRWPDQPVVFRSTVVRNERIEFALDGMANKTLVYERAGTDTMRVTLNDPEDAAPSVFEFRRKK